MLGAIYLLRMLSLILILSFSPMLQAEELVGSVAKIDLTGTVFEVGGKVFVVSPENESGLSLKELKEGDEVTVMFANPKKGEIGNPINAIRKAE